MDQESHIKEDVKQIRELDQQIHELLSDPLGLGTGTAKRSEQYLTAKEWLEIIEENEGGTGSIRFYNIEVDLEKKFNDRIQPLINIFGYKDYLEVPWAEWTKNVLIVYFVLTALSMITRPDYISLTVISLSYFSLELPSCITIGNFRMLVLFALVSFIYELIFLLFIRYVQAEDEEIQVV